MTPCPTPDFNQLLAVLEKRRPERPVLFEFCIDQAYLRRCLEATGGSWIDPEETGEEKVANWVRGYHAAGYDYATFPIWAADIPNFGTWERDKMASIGMAHGGVISDRESFERFAWPDMEQGDYDIFERVASLVPEGMRIVLIAPAGILETVTALLGYEDLCYLLADDRDLVRDIADAVGSRMLRFYEKALPYDIFGGAFVSDDWGFKTQLFLPPDDLREFIFPWHKKIAAAIHSRKIPAILHSCGLMEAVWEDIIGDMRYDGKHSYEDTIQPVEGIYERFAGRIAIMGGIDVDFLCRETPEAIYRRCREMLERSESRGGYALGSGNSIPAYVPFDNFTAMRRAALDAR